MVVAPSGIVWTACLPTALLLTRAVVEDATSAPEVVIHPPETARAVQATDAEDPGTPPDPVEQRAPRVDAETWTLVAGQFFGERTARHVDAGPRTRMLATAVAFDGVSTLMWLRNCRECIENPLTRLVLGERPGLWRMGVVGVVEVAGVAMIPRRDLRRAAQTALIVVHLVAGTRNIWHWHRPR